MLQKIVFAILATVMLGTLAISMPVLANVPQGVGGDAGFTFDLNVITHEDVRSDRWIDQGINYVINRVISIAAQTIGGIAVLAFALGAGMLLTSGGDDQKVEKGKGMMLAAIKGLVFVLAAYLLVVAIQTLVTSIF